jgi:fibronectin type 3 domain-containing protein
MKDVRDGGNVDESRFPGCTQRRRPSRWLRALAAACLALTMAGGSAMMASGTASAASASVLAPNNPCSVLSAERAGQRFCLKADAGLHQVQLTWNPSAPVKSVTVYQGDAQGNGQPAKVINVTDKSAVVPRLADGVPYYFWLVAGGSMMSDIVSATPVELLTVPGTPVGLAASARDAQVSLSWDAPVPSGDLKVSGYNVYQGTSPGGESDSPVNSSLLTSTNYVVTGLTNGSTYYFTVKAVTVDVISVKRVANAASAGQASCEVSATPATVPGPPARLTAAPGDRRVTLSWDRPASDGGSQVSGYNVYQGTSPGGEGDTPVNGSPVTSTSYPVTGLTNGSTYYFTVKAVNAHGPGAASAEVPSTPLTVPEAPTQLTAAPGDRQVTLTWSAPAPDGGSKVSSYNVYYATSADFQGAAEVRGVTGTALVLVGLVNGTTYHFRVTAVSNADEGPPSGEVPAIPVTVPGAPAGLSAAPGDRQVTLKWDPPASDGGSPVTGYDLYVGSTAHFGGRGPLAEVTGRAVIVTGLANGTTYYFRVTAVSKVGQGPPSNEVPAVPLTVPGAPTRLTATPGNSKATLTWTAPASGGAPIKGYIIYQGTSPDGETGTPVNGSLVSGTSHTVTGLTNGTIYFFKVVAVNAAGLSPLSAEASAALKVIVPPASTAPASTAPASTAPASTAPASTAPASTAPASTAPASTAPASTAPASTAPASTAPASTAPASTAPASTAPARTAPASTAPARTAPASTAPASTAPASTAPASTAPASTAPASTAPASTAPASTAPASTAPASTAPALTAPTGLTATAGDTQVHLSWTAPTSNGGSPVASYKIYVARVPGVQELPAVGTATTTDATVTKLSNRAVYYFMVTAVNAARNESPLSTEVSAEPVAHQESVPLSPPGVPPQLIALITAAAATATAVGFTLITRGRSGSGSRKRERPKRPRQEIEAGSNVRAVADAVRVDAVNVRDTGQEPTHTIRLEPHPGVSTTTIKEGRP